MKSIPIAVVLAASFPAGAETVAVYDLETPLSESGRKEPSLLGIDFEASRPLTLFDVSQSLAKAAADPDVSAIVLDADDTTLGLAQAQEIRRRLLDAREAGKDVWLYSDRYDTKTALLGSAANHSVLMPEADVSFSGLCAESMYFKGLLDKAGIEADVIHIGDFKSFGEEFYRTGPSEFSQKQTEELVGGVFGQIIDEVVGGRSADKDRVLALVDRGTFTAEEARDAKLVDELQYRTDFNTRLKDEYPDATFDAEYALPDLDGPDIDGIFDLFKLMLDSGRGSHSDNDYVAVVVLEGAITNESIAPVRREILRLLKDEHAKALVLRVDSPGGSALSSEVLWEATDEWKAAGRTFAVSMGATAASGGYYVSAGAERIFAEPGTITGSIGVVGMKLVVAGALEKLGITTHTVQRGKNAGAMSMTRPFTAEQTELVRQSMLDVYATFKKRVTDGRGDRLAGDLEGMAGGRVYTGARARELGLVDELGGLHEAIDWAAREAGIESGDVRLVPEPKSPLEGLFAKPEKHGDDEFVGMGRSAHPASDAIRASIRQAGLAPLPGPAVRGATRALELLDAISESQAQLIGPGLELRW